MKDQPVNKRLECYQQQESEITKGGEIQRYYLGFKKKGFFKGKIRKTKNLEANMGIQTLSDNGLEVR